MKTKSPPTNVCWLWFILHPIRPSAQDLLKHPFMKAARPTDALSKLLEARRAAEVRKTYTSSRMWRENGPQRVEGGIERNGARAGTCPCVFR